jgi:antitoxin (DNA-binding transcriptional repressor) of toxin-antitoxin stability system
MRSALSVTDVTEHFDEYLHRVEDRGESFVLMRGGHAVAELRPVSQRSRLRDLPGLLASLPRLPEDEAASFAADLEAARAELEIGSPRDPWGS